MDIFKRPIFLAIFLVALIIAIIWSYYDKQRQEKASRISQSTEQTATTSSPKTLSSVDPTDFDSVIKEEYTLANTKAIHVNPSNKISAIEIKIPGDLMPNTGTTTYVYTSKDDNKTNWIITFSQSSGNYIRAAIPKEDYFGPLQAIDTSLWKFNYVTALQIAEKGGGSDWHKSNELTGVTLTLRHLLPKNWLIWTVEYQGKNQNLTKNIDANSGRILDDYAGTATNGSQ